MQVLFVTPEVHPLIKVGGLGDVSGALPAALRRLGVDVRLLVPGYPQVLEGLPEVRETGWGLEILPGFDARLRQGELPEGEPIYILDCPKLYTRVGGPYSDMQGHDWQDNALRFGALCRMAGLLSRDNGIFKPDLIHCNDWTTGMVPMFMERAWYAPKSLITIHNIAFHGLFARDIIPVLGLPGDGFNMSGYEFNGMVSFLKAGLVYCDSVVAVSPNYAEEVQTPAYGCGLHGLMHERRDSLSGILNGIDTTEWDPATDALIFAPYDADHLKVKQENKRALCERLGLSTDPHVPLLGLVSRLTYQKGIDLLLEVFPKALEQGAQIAILGLGESKVEHELQKFAGQYPGRVSLVLGYDESLSHQIEAGADIFLMPSRFEPCGLNQMYSMRYGTPPLVRRTGGLADTVVDTTPANLDAGTATGFVFKKEDPKELYQCLLRALLVFRDKPTWRQIQRAGMACDFSWDASARGYMKEYERILA